jgi:hypothetical protein
MQRMFNLSKWTKISEGETVEFPSTRNRRVRVEVNSPAVSRIWTVNDDGDLTFLARINGRDSIEFFAVGQLRFHIEGGEVWIYTSDGEDISAVIPDAQSFTRVMERRQRNPQLEYIAAQMEANMNRRMEKQADEIAALYARREAALVRRSEADLAARAAGALAEKAGTESVSSPDTNSPTGKGKGAVKAPA